MGGEALGNHGACVAGEAMKASASSSKQPAKYAVDSLEHTPWESDFLDPTEDVLFRLLDEAPTTDHMELTLVTCDTILNAWAQQGTREGAERAQMILFRLEEWQRNDIRPTKLPI
jgi:ADP-ribosylglycohydrolase